MSTESIPKPPEQESTAVLEVKKMGWLERGKLARDMMKKTVIDNGLNRLREVDVNAIAETAARLAANAASTAANAASAAAGAAVSGKDHIVQAGVAAGMMALDVTGLEDAHIVGHSHKLLGFVGKTLTDIGSRPDGSRSVKMAGKLMTTTAGFMKNHPGMVASAEKRLDDAIHEKIKKFREYGSSDE